MRNWNRRFIASGTIIFDSPMHIGGETPSGGMDAPFLQNGQGEYVIPGTSLAGVLRSWMHDHYPSSTDTVFGPRKLSDSDGFASNIFFEDAVICKSTGVLRHGVGIDRYTNSSRPHFKYDHVILGAGAKATFRIVCTLSEGDNLNHDKALLATLIALRDGDISIGAHTTKGHGRISAKDLCVKKQNFDRNSMLNRITDPDSGIPVELDDFTTADSTYLTVTAKFTALSPVMSNQAIDGGLVDSIPRVEMSSGDAYLVLPGSSLKGVLRSECERIVRTVCKVPFDLEQDFPLQLNLPLINEMFGHPETKSSADDSSNGRRGALNVSDVRAPICPQALWETILVPIHKNIVKSDDLDRNRANQIAELYAALENAKLDWHIGNHVAIDRWSGEGGSGGALYSVLEPHGASWEPLQLQVDINRLNDEMQIPAIALLLSALHGLHSGRIGLGFGVNRGLGRVRLDSLQFSGRSTIEEFQLPTNVSFPAQQDTDPGEPFWTLFPEPAVTQIREGWKTWIKNERIKINQSESNL